MIEIFMMGFRSRNVSDYIKMIQLQSHESHWFFKIVFTQVSIYVSIFFTMLILWGALIKEQIPKKLVSSKHILVILTIVYKSLLLGISYQDIDKSRL